VRLVPETPGKNAYPFAPSRDPERWSFRFAPCKMSIPRTQQRTDFRRKQELFPILGSRFGYGRFCLKLERREKKCQHRATQRNRQLCFTTAPVSTANRRLVGTKITTMAKEAGGILSGDGVKSGTERVLECLDRTGGDAAQV
jgi:hypothetical protein